MSPLLMPFTPRFITFTLCIIAVPVFGIAWIADPHPVLAICFIAAAVCCTDSPPLAASLAAAAANSSVARALWAL